jgi:hypothetical protein
VYNLCNDQPEISMVCIDCSLYCKFLPVLKHHTMKTYLGTEAYLHMFNSNIQNGLLCCNRKCCLSSFSKIPRPHLSKINGCSTSQTMQPDQFRVVDATNSSDEHEDD